MPENCNPRDHLLLPTGYIMRVELAFEMGKRWEYIVLKHRPCSFTSNCNANN